MEVRSGILLFLVLFCRVIHADYVAHSDPTGDESDTTEFTVLVVFGVIFAIQIIVFMLFACKGYDAVYGPRSGRSDSESQQGFQFPFLPSYEMAVNDTRLNQQSTETSSSNSSIDDGVIVDISRLSVDSSTENQSDTSETNRSSVDTSSVDTPLSNDTID